VGTVKLGSKCTDWLLVWDNLGRNEKYIWNVISLWLVGTCRSHVQGTSQMSFTCVWWLHHRQSVPVPTMFLRCSHLFPGALAPSDNALGGGYHFSNSGPSYPLPSKETRQPLIGLTTGSLVEPAGEDRGEGGSSHSGVPSRGDVRMRRRARGRGQECEETLRKREGERRNLRRREEKRKSDKVEDKGRPSSFFRGS